MMEIQITEEDKVQYTTYPNLPQIKQGYQNYVKSIQQDLSSNNWKQHFDGLTKLRILNKNEGQNFIDKVFRLFFKQVCNQVDNLRSNNSKQALTLINQIFRYNKVTNLQDQIIATLVTKLFIKSCSQKGFLKNQARDAIKRFPKIQHSYLIIQLSRQTQSPNYQISQLAILTLKQCLSSLMISKQNYNFNQYLKILSKNIQGKRALIQKTSKQIVALMDKCYTTEGLTHIIKNSNIAQQQKKVLINQILAAKQSKQAKGKASLKDFIKQKKMESQKSQN